jgi:ParB-like chromosome segregation protein Spo0J
MRLIGDLIVPKRKLRSIDPLQVMAIATSIQNLGFCVPVIIDRDNKVLDGVSRLEAARSPRTYHHLLCRYVRP